MFNNSYIVEKNEHYNVSAKSILSSDKLEIRPYQWTLEILNTGLC